MTKARIAQVIFALLSCNLSPLNVSSSSRAATIAGGVITEDFTTLQYADLSLSSSATSTGVWDIAHQRARAHAFAAGSTDASKPIDFGNGSDGVLSSATGYTFNTNTHPSGFSFQSVSITGGTITISGAYPLVIRSLGTMTIIPTLDVSGAAGSAGSLTGSAVLGGVAKTCSANGGAGGAAALAAGQNGGDSLNSNGTAAGLGEYGVGQTTGVYNSAIDGQGSLSGPATNASETASNFVCGGSGPGGGGYSTGTTTFGSGGSGGAGGGILKLVAAGDMAIGSTNASGGNGGSGVTVATGPNRCSGNGSGGNGGLIWMQTLGNLTTTSIPITAGGTAGTTVCGIGSGTSTFTALTRGDVATGAAQPAWAAGSLVTDVVPANLQSVVQSKVYDMGVLNAGFTTPTLTTTGTVSVAFAGSQDGTHFSSYDSTLTNLSNHHYRFLKFQATFTNPTSAGSSPTLSLVKVPYQELGLPQVGFGLAAGCGSIKPVDPKLRGDVLRGIVSTGLWFLAMYALAKFRRVSLIILLVLSQLPAAFSQTLSGFSYPFRNYPYQGWTALVKGDNNSVGMAGANAALPSNISGMENNPAGTAMFLNGAAAQFNQNTINGATEYQYGIGGSIGRWGFGYFYYSPSTEGVGNSTIAVKQYRAAGAYMIGKNTSFGASVEIDQAIRTFDGDDEGGAQLSYQLGLLHKFDSHLVLSLAFKPGVDIPTSSNNLSHAALFGFNQITRMPAIWTFGFGFIPNRFFKAGMSVLAVGATENTALLFDQTEAYGRRFTIQPRVGASYVFADYKNLTAEVAAGTYYEFSRIDNIPDRLHSTFSVNVNPWFVNAGVGADLATNYSNWMVSLGLDFIRSLRFLEIIPPDPVPPLNGMFPRPTIVNADGLAPGLTAGEARTTPATQVSDISKIVTDIPAKVEAKFNQTFGPVKKIKTKKKAIPVSH